MAIGDIIDAVSAVIPNKHFDVRLGVFGEQGAGKTTLLAAYYGNQRSDGWAKEHGYSLLAEDAGQGRQIYANYVGLVEDRKFPQGSFDFTEYRFSLQLHDPQNPTNPLSCLRICWYDYPGKWWTDIPSDIGERATREAALHKLLTCHVGILLFDGYYVSREGRPYLQTLLASFRDQVSRHRAEMHLQNRHSVYPTQWILALTKADMFDARFSAHDFKQLVEKNAGVELDELGRIIGKTVPYRWTYLLLSSARAQGNQVESAERPLGLELIVPLALLSSVEKVGRVTILKKIQSMGIIGLIWAGVATKVMLDLFGKVTEADAAVADSGGESSDGDKSSYGVSADTLSDFLVALVITAALNKGIAYLHDKQAKAVRRKDVIHGTIFALQAELASESAQRLSIFSSPAEPPVESTMMYEAKSWINSTVGLSLKKAKQVFSKNP